MPVRDKAQLVADLRKAVEDAVAFCAGRGVSIAEIEKAAPGSNIEDLFHKLLVLTRALSEEQQRHVRENLSEEELTVFDLQTRPGPELTPEERDEVKKVAKLLMERVRALLVLDWRRRNDARARVRITIEDALDSGLPRAYTPEVCHQKCATVFEHVFESYGGKRAGEAA